MLWSQCYKSKFSQFTKETCGNLISLLETGLPDFSWYNIPKRGKICQITTRFQNAHNICPTVVKYSEWRDYITTIFIPRPSKIYPNWDFWSEKKLSGNPRKEPNRIKKSQQVVKCFDQSLILYLSDGI
jgi:hypothetical protein